MACCENASDGAGCSGECLRKPLELLKKIVEEWQYVYPSEGITFDLADAIDNAEEYVKSCVRA